MSSYFEKYRKELQELISSGEFINNLFTRLIDSFDNLDARIKLRAEIVEKYECWYSKSLEVVRDILPNRLKDFTELYKSTGATNSSPVTVSGFFAGVTHRTALNTAGLAQMLVRQQFSIVSSAQERFGSCLFDTKSFLQADLFDSELEAAKEFLKKGFLRPAGVIAGVVLEKHLSQICQNHSVAVAKKDPGISEFNDLLKTAAVIDIPNWRNIQRLGDLRNLCSHSKDREPKVEEVDDLINGVDKVIKTIF